MRQSPRGKCDTKASNDGPTMGAITAIRLFSAATAPIAWPCVFGSAALDTMLWIDEAAAKPSTLMKITAYIIQPSVAAPHSA